MIRVKGLLLSMVLFSSVCFSAEVYFSPSADCENRIEKAILQTKTELVAAIYSINNAKIIDALQDAKKRGVAIRILTDHTQAAGRSSKILEMLDGGLDVRVHSKFKIEHNKFGVFDGKLVGTGSFNWTGPAARSNSENCIFLTDLEVISEYKNRFEFLWGINSADGSRARIAALRKGRKQKDPSMPSETAKTAPMVPARRAQ